MRRKHKSDIMHVVHKATNRSAIAMKRPDGMVIVQFDRRDHPNAYGWHLYPRRDFRPLLVKRLRRLCGSGHETGRLIRFFLSNSRRATEKTMR